MAKLASTQIEQLREIGAYLCQVRQQQGRAIDDIANQIFIRPALLRAVEEGDPQYLPEPVFVQGFIRRYAEALGLDGNALSKEFTVTLVSPIPEPMGTPSVAPVSNGHTAAEPELRPPIQFSPEPPVPERRVTRARSSGGLPLALIAGGIALAVGVGLGIWSLTHRASQPAATNPAPTTADPKPTVGSSPPATPTPATPPPVDLEAPVVADLTLNERSWISIVVDGQKVYEGILEGGTEETYKAQNDIKITSGNAGGVSLSFNGNPPITMGEPGSVKTMTLTPDTDPASLSLPN